MSDIANSSDYQSDDIFNKYYYSVHHVYWIFMVNLTMATSHYGCKRVCAYGYTWRKHFGL